MQDIKVVLYACLQWPVFVLRFLIPVFRGNWYTRKMQCQVSFGQWHRWSLIPPLLRKQRQVDLYKLEASLVYGESSRIAKTTQRNPVLNNKQTNKAWMETQIVFSRIGVLATNGIWGMQKWGFLVYKQTRLKFWQPWSHVVFIQLWKECWVNNEWSEKVCILLYGREMKTGKIKCQEEPWKASGRAKGFKLIIVKRLQKRLGKQLRQESSTWN